MTWVAGFISTRQPIVVLVICSNLTLFAYLLKHILQAWQIPVTEPKYLHGLLNEMILEQTPQ